MLADVLPRHTLTASMVWRWLVEVLAGLSIKAAAEKLRLPFALETIYRLRRRMLRGLDPVEKKLPGEKPQRISKNPQILLQTLEHLKAVFPDSSCPPADFQLHFQHPFLG